MIISEQDIVEVEKMVLPKNCKFSGSGKEFLLCDVSKEVLACPGSGKTTLLMAKLYLLSKSMPFSNNEGICVLSHTNVAVNEIKKKLGSAADKILGYPNFVGTIQSFIDKFVLFPYLTHFTTGNIEVVDEKRYGIYMWRECKYNTELKQLKNLILGRVKVSKYYENNEELVRNLYLNKEELWLGKTKIAGSNAPSTLQFRDLKEILKLRGIVKYNDSYELGIEAIEEYGDELVKLISKRFRYAFVDEYQDCNHLQCKVINQLLKKTTLQKIGDVDQAIYNNISADEIAWSVSEDAFILPGSNRYHQKIANILVPLRTKKESIISLINNRQIPPTLIVYSENKINDVIDTYYKEIKSNKLDELCPNGKFTAIGMIKNGKGITIGDYWDKYKKEEISSGSLYLDDYIYEIVTQLEHGNLYNVDKVIKKMLCQIYFICGYVDNKSSQSFTVNTIKNKLYSDENIDYPKSIIELCKLENFSYKEVRDYILSQIKVNFKSPDIIMLKNFIKKQSGNTEMGKIKNVWKKENNGDELDIEFGTVYKVKGETHTATLYLETETSGASDIKRIMPLFNGEKIRNAKLIHEKSRKVVYVGFSRPSHLLCLAIQKKTFLGNESAFSDWKIIKLE
ncbi:MAG: UvrD-helicase domain-containing protein [Firmicutes bacterium]|nr:UvrD-helicase domain-containing protein [Bacillota bacterium]